MLVSSLWINQEPILRLETKPKRQVYALQAYAIGQLILIPYSESIIVDDETPANNGSRIKTDQVGKVSLKSVDGQPVWIGKPPINFPKPDAEKKTGNVEIFWCVRDLEHAQKKDGGETPSDPEAKNINMDLKTYRVLGAMAIKPQSDAPSADVTLGGMHLSRVAL